MMMMSMLMMFFSMFILMMFLNLNSMMMFFQNLFFLFFIILLIKFLMIINYNNWMFIFNDFMIDKISMLMILLSVWILCLMMLTLISFGYKEKLMTMMLMMIISLILFFSSMDLLKFYLFYEISLIPILIIIIGWGNQIERLEAGIYLLFYMLIVSLPFLLMIMLIYYELNVLSMIYLMELIYLKNMNFYLYLNMVMIFLVKLPIYFVHIWLPKAHVEAPIFGSMILAGVLLKLGGYGFMRLMMIFSSLFLKFNLFFISMMFIGVLNISLLCMRQIDLKMMIAYSSIVHMGTMMISLMMMYKLSIMMSLFMMIGHGLCSSGLFCLLNFSYNRFNSRSLIFNKGLIQLFMNMSMWWFLFMIINMASPFSLNLISEIMLIKIMLKYNFNLFILIIFISFFSSVYTIYLYSFSQHGMNFLYFNNVFFNVINEYLLMYLHYVPLNIFIFYLNFM